MNTIETEWFGFKKIDFDFGDRKAILVCPENPVEGNKWLYKTEYFGAFPDFEIEMLKRGYYLAHIENICRWCPEDDTDKRKEFCELLSKEFSLNKKCMPVGMSCGGMQAVYFATKYPEYVAALYLDAPVLNLLSCPFALGEATVDFKEEFEKSMGITQAEILNFRNHPIDNKEKLLKSEIPVLLICGDSDKVVPYKENGKILSDYFKANNGNLTEILKLGCDHHPHGLADTQQIVEFTEKYY